MSKRLISIVILYVFILNNLLFDICPIFAQGTAVLSTPGTMPSLSVAYTPPLLKGVKFYRDNPFQLDFILNKGDSATSDDGIKAESHRLIKYFLASVTIPDNDLWVNLSPTEKDYIVPEAFGQTEMGRDLLAQDYLLKQITSSLFYPESETGKAFWAKVYAEALKRYGTSDVPVDTFNKVWIVPEKALVYEGADTAYVVESKLKVMLEEDYLAIDKSADTTVQPKRESNKFGSDIVREVMIPVLEKEINQGKNFAQLRQIYHSLILAVWYKNKIRKSIFGKAFVDKKKTDGVDIEDKTEKEKIWAQYVETLKKGAYNYIKEDYDPQTDQIVARKYFSGGFRLVNIGHTAQFITDPIQSSNINEIIVHAKLNVSSPITDLRVQSRHIFDNLASLIAWIEKNTGPNDQIEVAPRFGSVGFITDKKGFPDEIRKFAQKSAGDFFDPDGPAGVSVLKNDERTTYGVVLSGFSKNARPYEKPNENEIVYHAAPMQRALAIIKGGKYSLPGRRTFYMVPHSSTWRSDVLLPFKIPRKYLFWEKSSYFSPSTLGIKFNAPYYKNQLPDDFRRQLLEESAKLKDTTIYNMTNSKFGSLILLAAERTGFLMYLPFHLSDEILTLTLEVNKRRVRDNMISNGDFAILKEALEKRQAEYFNSTTADQVKKGGIDLTTTRFNVETQEATGEMRFTIDTDQLEQLQNGSGLIPIIINIEPMKTSLPVFLGTQKKDFPS